MGRDSVRCQETPYGFIFGAARVERCATDRGYVVIEVATPREVMHVTVTPKGLIRTAKKKTAKSAKGGEHG